MTTTVYFDTLTSFTRNIEFIPKIVVNNHQMLNHVNKSPLMAARHGRCSVGYIKPCGQKNKSPALQWSVALV